jgi:outer membrane protein assembly factor BamB
MIALAALAWAWGDAVRLDGLGGQGDPAFRPRWSRSGEEQFLAERAHNGGRAEPRPIVDDVEPLDATAADWPEFRGPVRDGAVRGVTIRTDWNEKPPRLLWKRRVGPAWSSITVVGNRLFTQEQRDQQEAVVAFDADTGNEVWVHEDQGRFEEAMGGVGPRATPTFAGGKLFALGAKGLLNALDAATGRRLWSCDIVEDGEGKIPYWGFSSSPLVVDGKLIVFAGGGGENSHPGEPHANEQNVQKGKASAAEENKNTLLAYEVESGQLAWQAAAGSSSYSSPQLATIDGVPQVLFLSDAGLQGFEPATGEKLWTLPSNAEEAMPSLQPHLLNESQLIASFSGGIVRASVAQEGSAWRVRVDQTGWAGRDIKPFFNDIVRTGDAIYGLDGKLLCCIDAETGKRRWKKGRYGSGQVLLIADQPVLLVISEAGLAALVECNPEEYVELGRFQAIEGKTWNHPTVVRGRLYVRNAEEMACYEL